MYKPNSRELITTYRIVNIKDALTELYNNQINPKETVNLIPTGFGETFDSFTQGLPQKGLLLVSAESTVHSSLFFSNLFFNQLISGKYKCSYYSFDLKASDLIRLSYTRFHPDVFQGSKEEADLESFQQFYESLTKSDSHILEASIMSLEELEEVLCEEVNDGTKIIFINNLNHIYINDKYESRDDPQKVMSFLNQFACEQEITIIALFKEYNHEAKETEIFATPQRQYLRALENSYTQLWFVNFKRDDEGTIVMIKNIISNKHFESYKEFLWNRSSTELTYKVYEN